MLPSHRRERILSKLAQSVPSFKEPAIRPLDKPSSGTGLQLPSSMYASATPTSPNSAYVSAGGGSGPINYSYGTPVSSGQSGNHGVGRLSATLPLGEKASLTADVTNRPAGPSERANTYGASLVVRPNATNSLSAGMRKLPGSEQYDLSASHQFAGGGMAGLSGSFNPTEQSRSGSAYMSVPLPKSNSFPVNGSLALGGHGVPAERADVVQW